MKKFDLKSRLKPKRSKTTALGELENIQSIVTALAQVVADKSVEDFGGQFHIPVVDLLDGLMPVIEKTYGFRPDEFLALVNREK